MVREEGKKPTNTIWLFCEGETEKFYFQKLKAKERIMRFNVKVKSSGRTDAFGMVRYSLNFQKSCPRDFLKGDQIYCVFDRDNNTNKNLEKAIKMADDNDIQIIYSNPCFEYWVLCHFEYYPHKCEFVDIKPKLDKHVKKYVKSDKEIYDKTEDKINEAVKNSQKIIEKHKKDNVKLISRESNPSTHVHKIIEEFKKLKQ